MANQAPIRPSDVGSSAETEQKYEDSEVDTHNENRLAPDETVSKEDREFYEKYGTYDRYEITEEDCYDELGFCFPTWKKWMILSIVFTVQVSMNFNTSLYSNGVHGISEEFGVSAQAARLGAAIFLITYAFGCELWAVCFTLLQYQVTCLSIIGCCITYPSVTQCTQTFGEGLYHISGL